MKITILIILIIMYLFRYLIVSFMWALKTIKHKN